MSAFVIGAILGSAFLCLLDRWKRGESWLKGRSHCTSCGHELAWRDLIPIYSYLHNRGRCRYCGKPYPMATLLSELVMGYATVCAAYAAFSFCSAGNYASAVAHAATYILLGAAAINDIYCHECEYIIQYGILAVGLVYAFFYCELSALIGCAIVAGVLIIIDLVFRVLRGTEGIGFADIVVLTGAAAIVTDLILIPMMLVLTCAASLLALPIAKKNQTMQGMEEALPGMGLLPFVLIGISLCNLLGRVILPMLYFR